MKKRLFLLLYLLLAFQVIASSQESGHLLSFLQGKRIYPVVFLDPLECQLMGGSYFMHRNKENADLYSTVNLGFNLPVLSGTTKDISWEFNFGTANFTQFGLDRKKDGSYLAGLINSDFKLSCDYSIRKGNNIFRLRLFHISSHLGDDFTRRNSDSLKSDKSNNYEQVDFSYLRALKKGFYYATTGIVYTKYVIRKRFSITGGGLMDFGGRERLNFFTASDIKLLAENYFYPDIRGAFGIAFKRQGETLIRIWAEYYSGRLPYSIIDLGRVTWAGLAMSINLLR